MYNVQIGRDECICTQKAKVNAVGQEDFRLRHASSIYMEMHMTLPPGAHSCARVRCERMHADMVHCPQGDCVKMVKCRETRAVIHMQRNKKTQKARRVRKRDTTMQIIYDTVARWRKVIEIEASLTRVAKVQFR